MLSSLRKQKLKYLLEQLVYLVIFTTKQTNKLKSSRLVSFIDPAQHRNKVQDSNPISLGITTYMITSNNVYGHRQD